MTHVKDSMQAMAIMLGLIPTPSRAWLASM
jgi:hypothetical protein